MISACIIASFAYAGNLKPVAQKISEKKTLQQQFQQVQLFEITTASVSRAVQLRTTVSESSVMEFRQQDVQSILNAKPENVIFRIPQAGGTLVELELYRSDIFTPDFAITTSGSNGKPVPYTGGVHYWGIVKGDYNSIAAISVFDNEVMGMVSTHDGNFVLGKLENDKQARHIYYNERHLSAASNLKCFTEEDNVSYKQKDLQGSNKVMANCIRLFWEVNLDIYNGKGSVANAANYVTGLFNQSAVIYANDAIPVELSEVFVWNTTSPYTSTSTSGLLGQFQNYRNTINGDLGHLLGYAGGGGVAAGFNGICAANLNSSQCYSGISSSYQNVPTYSWSVEVVTHEQGHLMGSRHTHACVWNGNNTAIDNCGPTAGYGYEGSCSGAPTPVGGGTIMSYCHLVGSVGINFNNGFGTQPKNVILNNFNNGVCLTACIGTSCMPSVNMSTAGIQTTTATFNWAPVSNAVSYNIRYRVVGAGTWLTGTSATATYNAIGLTPGANYEWQVQTICSGGSSIYTISTNFTTTPQTCLPPANLSTTNVSFSSATFNWSAASGALSYNVQYRIVGSGTWSTGTTATTSFNASGLTASSNYEWQVQTVCSGGGISSFSSSSLFTTTAQPCISSQNNYTTGITDVSATLNWNSGVGGAVGYNLRHRIVGTGSWINNSVNAPATSLSISGLIPASNYEWQIQTNCTGGQSAYSNSVLFTTLASPCNTPANMSAGSVTTNSATLSWSAVTGAVSYNVHYRISGTGIWTPANTSNTSYNASGLTASSVYEWQVQTVCQSDTSSYSSLATFTTSPCAIPGGLSSTNITSTSADLSWSAVSYATGYIVQWRVTGAGIWNNSSASANSYSLINLTANTTYEWQVQTICPGGNSAYSSIAAFTTSTAGCTDIYETNETVASAKIIAVNADIFGLITPSTDVDWYRFTTVKPNTNLMITLTNLPADYDVKLFATNGTSNLGTSQNRGLLNETIKRASNSNATYYLKVYPWQGANNANLCYTLKVNVASTPFPSPRYAGGNGSESSDNSVILYPNPASELFNINFNSFEIAAGHIFIYNSIGQRVYTSALLVAEGFNSFTVNSSPFPKGIYIFELELNGITQRMMFSVTH